jgi:glycyl-tRNA synthetase alpha chain
VGGIECRPITGEITYGLERLCMYLQDVDNVFDLVYTRWRDRGRERVLRYRDVFLQNEVEQSKFNFEFSDVSVLLGQFKLFESEAARLIAANLAIPAYETVLKAGHSFNLLDARGAISVTERAAYIGRIRTLARAVAQSYLESRERLGFPMLERPAGAAAPAGKSAPEPAR